MQPALKLEAWHTATSTSTDLEGHSQLVGFIYSMLARKSAESDLRREKTHSFISFKFHSFHSTFAKFLFLGFIMKADAITL